MGIKLFSDDAPLSNPDPTNCRIVEKAEFGRYTVILVHYPDCTTYDGHKILVYKDCTVSDGHIDPHFLEDGASPIARFAPNPKGSKMAMEFAAWRNDLEVGWW